MIILKSREEVDKLREANRIAAEVMEKLSGVIADGVRTAELEKIATGLILARRAKPAFPTVPGYHHTLCVSVNEEVVHGIPGKKRLKEGDVVSVDCGVLLGGFFGDHAWSFPVGKVSSEAKRLLAAGEEALMRGVAAAKAGGRLRDISAAIERCAEDAGFSVVRDYVGHGVGRELHEEPQVPNFGEPGTGMKLRRGLVLALEPMLNAGTHEVEVLPDGWTVVTKDRRLSVHFEHSVAIMDEGPEILSVL
ncbi:MAG: type I methionyl aminopeptidase [Pseudomonadota bacterium]